MKLPSKWHTYLQEGCARTKQVMKFKQLLSKICLNFFHINGSPLQNQTYVEVRNEALKLSHRPVGHFDNAKMGFM